MRARVLYDPRVERLVEELRREVATRRPPGTPTWNRAIRGEDGDQWRRRAPFVSLIWSIAFEEDAAAWIQISLSAGESLPSWYWMREGKIWIAGDRYAYLVFPPASQYVNLNPTVLHVFAPVDGKPRLPEFAGIAPDGSLTL